MRLAALALAAALMAVATLVYATHRREREYVVTPHACGWSADDDEWECCA